LHLTRSISAGTLWLAFAVTPTSAAALATAEVLDLDEAAAWLRVEADLVRELAEAQRLPGRLIGKQWRFSRAALLDWLRDAGPPRAASVAPASSPVATAPATPLPTVGEKSSAPTADEVALRDQRLLLPRGSASIDFGIAYSHSEQSLFPVLRQEQRTLAFNAAWRYGLGSGLQITLRQPWSASRATTFTDASLNGTPSRQVSRRDQAGDTSISLLGVGARESLGRPNLIWSVDATLPTGAGDRAIGAGLVVSKSVDPAVVFAGISYLRGIATDPANPLRSLARHNLGLSLGYTYAVNDALALNSVVSGSYRNTRSADGQSNPPPRERYQLQLGTTWLLARGLFTEPAVAMRLGGESTDLVASLNLNYSF
jgi:excisionase family DNA binding protein